MERRRDGETERRRDGRVERLIFRLSLCPYVSLSLCLCVPLSFHLPLSLLQRIASNAYWRPVNALRADDDHVAGVVEGQSNDRRTGEDDFGVAPIRRDADDAATPS